ncbi:MAG TPA: hypothetical protein VHE35_37350 [Kofleriaceae bacterium]|nr:hypothetical protein [Kofleriaceae bacterium]
MNVIEVSKYSATMLRRGRFLSEDWTSVSQLGQTWGGEVLTPARYLVTEDRYVAAAERFARAVGVAELMVVGLEYWRDGGIDGLLDGYRDPPREGEWLDRTASLFVLRRCLRELAWAELAVPGRLLIHPGHDLRLLIATSQPYPEVEEAVRSTGLFIHHGTYNLPTLDSWSTDPTE